MNQRLGGQTGKRLLLLPSQPSVVGAGRTQMHAPDSLQGNSASRKLRALLPTADKLVRTCLGRDEGNPLVEFAFIIPIFMMLVMGVFAFGITFNNYLQLTDAVGIAGRKLAISRTLTTDPCATAAAAVYAAAPALTQASLTFTFKLNGTTYNGTTCTAGANDIKNPNVDAQMTVTYPISINIRGTQFAKGALLQAQITE